MGVGTRFWKPFGALMVLGLIGVVSLLSAIQQSLAQTLQTQPELITLPIEILVILSLVQPAVLLAIAVGIGCLLAPRVGLVSLVYEKITDRQPILPRLRASAVLAAVLGLLLSGLIILLDQAFMPYLGDEFQALATQEGDPFLKLIMGLLYGGMTEELMLRWGFMTLLFWLGTRLFKQARTEGRSAKVVGWTAIGLAAVLFGAGHLPALSSSVTLTLPIILRTISLNAIGGFVFGWLFWRKNLEAAMVAHAMTHVGFFIIGLLV